MAQPYRYSRIEEYLASKDDLTAEDMMELQMDQKNKQAELFVPIFLDVLATKLIRRRKSKRSKY